MFIISKTPRDSLSRDSLSFSASTKIDLQLPKNHCKILLFLQVTWFMLFVSLVDRRNVIIEECFLRSVRRL